MLIDEVVVLAEKHHELCRDMKHLRSSPQALVLLKADQDPPLALEVRFKGAVPANQSTRLAGGNIQYTPRLWWQGFNVGGCAIIHVLDQTLC
jgi:hypothetical protein